MRAAKNGKRVGGKVMHCYAAASLIVALRRNGHLPEFIQEIAQEAGESANAILGLVYEVANSDTPLEAAKPQVYILRLRQAFQNLIKHITGQATKPISKLMDNLKPISVSTEPEVTAAQYLPALCAFAEACWPTPWTAPEAHAVACALLAYSTEMALAKPIAVLKEFFKHIAPHVYQTAGTVMNRYKALLEMFCSQADKITWVRARRGTTYDSKRRWLALGGLQEILKANAVSTDEIKQCAHEAGGVGAAVVRSSASLTDENGRREGRREEDGHSCRPPRKRRKLNTMDHIEEFMRKPEGCSIPFGAFKRPSWAVTTDGMSLIAYMHHTAATGSNRGRNPTRLDLYIASHAIDDLPNDGDELDEILFGPGEWEGMLRPPEEVSALARVMAEEWSDRDDDAEARRTKSLKDKEPSRARIEKRKKVQEAQGPDHLTNPSRTKSSKINYAVLASMGLDADCVLNNDEHEGGDHEVEVEAYEGDQVESDPDEARFLFVTEEDGGFVGSHLHVVHHADDDTLYYDTLFDEGGYEEEL
jgi:hypothetical protein